MKCFKHFKSIILTAVLAFCCGTASASSAINDEATGTVIFYESFDQAAGTGGNDGSWSGNIATSNLDTDNSGWTFEKQGGASKCAKFGTGSAQGSAETPAINATGNLTLTFKAGAWTGDATSLTLSATNATLSETSVTLADSKFTEYTINITNAKAGFKVKFTAKQKSKSRFFLDEVTITGEGGGTVTPPEPDNHVYASLAALVAAGAPTAEGYDVTVTLTNEPIKSIYVTSKGYRNGIYLDGGSHDVEIFCYDVPEDWVKGGTVSGTLTCPWKLYNMTWELCPTSWNDLTYTAPTDQPGGGDEGGNTPEGDNVSWDLCKASYAAASDEQVTWTNAVATMVADKEKSTTKANNYLGEDANARTSSRFYKDSKLTITPAKGYTITAIVYDATTEGHATALATSTWTNATAKATAKTATITPTKGDEAISAIIGATTGGTKVTIYYTTSGTTVGLISNESTTTASPIYNLQGQRISRAQKGVNVVNGKKVIR